MKYKVLVVLFFMLVSVSLWGQTTSVTATIHDPNGQAFANGTYVINFVTKPGNPGPYTQNGVPFTQSYSGNLNSSGLLVVTLPDNSTIQPLGSQWAFTVTPQASVSGTQYVTPITGGSVDISAGINALVPKISIQGALLPYAYSDAEVSNAINGVTYYNGVTPAARIFFNGAWATFGGGGGGGGGATFSPNAVQYATSTTAARASIASDIVNLFSTCSGTQYLGADGNCHTAAGAGTVTNTLGALTANQIMIGNNGSDAFIDPIATLDGNGNSTFTSTQTTGNGTNPGLILLQGNTTSWPVTSGYVGIEGPSSSAIPGYVLQLSGTTPVSAGLCFKTGTPNAGLIPVTYSTCGGTGGSEAWRTLKLSVQQGGVAGTPAGCSIGWDMPASGYPTGYAFPSTSTQTGRCGAQFATNAYMSTVVSMPDAYIANTNLTFRVSWLHPTDTNVSHTDTWGYQIVCQSPISATAVAQPALNTEVDAVATTVNAVAGNYSTVDLVITPNAGGITACNPLDELRLRIILHATTASDNPVLMFAAWKDQ